MNPLKLLRLALLPAALGLANAAAFNGVDLAGTRSYAQDFSLRDHDGRLRRLADFGGRPVVVLFGYLQCPNYCPTALARLAEARRLLDARGHEVQVLFVTLDPERDEPRALKEYVGAFDPDFLALRPAPAEVARLALSFRVYYRRVAGRTPDNYHIDHAVFAYAYDRRGRLRLRLSDGLSAEAIAADLARLLDEPAANAG